MKSETLILLLLLLCCPASRAGSPRPFQTIHLDSFQPDVHGCDVKWTADVNQMAWIGDEHLAVWLIYFCYSPGIKDRKSPTELVIFDTGGHAHSIWSDLGFGFIPGPSETLLIGHGSDIEVLDTELRTKKTMECPVENAACAIFTPSPHSTNSEFALCSYSALAENCDFYHGLPVEKLSETKLQTVPSHGIPIDPYKETNFSSTGPSTLYGGTGWRVGPSEFWYFDDHRRLLRADSRGSLGPVSVEKWTPDYSNCSGELSASEPRRFLAACVGAHVYTDGALDTLFGYSRIALFDVASRHILTRINGPAYTSAVLSPSGKLIAIEHENKVRLYHVN